MLDKKPHTYLIKTIKSHSGAGNVGSGGAVEIYLGVKHGILTPRCFGKKHFLIAYTGQLILSKIIKTVATSCQILRLKWTKFDFSWGSAPDSAGGTYCAPSDPLVGFKGPGHSDGGWGISVHIPSQNQAR